MLPQLWALALALTNNHKNAALNNFNGLIRYPPSHVMREFMVYEKEMIGRELRILRLSGRLTLTNIILKEDSHVGVYHSHHLVAHGPEPG
jgi:hypothetical protein